MDIYSYDMESLRHILIEKGEKGYRAEQIFYWLYERGIDDPEGMVNLNRSTKELIGRELKPDRFSFEKIYHSKDCETSKFLWKLSDERFVESVLIRSKGRNTLCLSSQVGCRMGCRFCASSKMGFIRNLTRSEIVRQVVHMARFLKGEGERFSNIVFMGMGEPLDNYWEVIKSISIIRDGFNISKRRITISTVGIIEGIERLIEDNLGVNLVLSLHAADQAIRESIIESGKRNRYSELFLVLRRYFEKSGRDVTLEYILIDGVNDRREDAEKLASMVSKHFNVNLIPYNEVEGLPFKRSKNRSIAIFKEILKRRGVAVSQRYTKGADIDAACGQLALKEKK